MFILSLAWRPSSLGAGRLNRCSVWVWVWLEASCFLEMEPWLDASNPEKWSCLDRRVQGWGLGLARGLCFLEMEPWLEASHPEQMDLWGTDSMLGSLDGRPH